MAQLEAQRFLCIEGSILWRWPRGRTARRPRMRAPGPTWRARLGWAGAPPEKKEVETHNKS
eukprot:9211800-Lingulodinium_polyedra.AAC.1